MQSIRKKPLQYLKLLWIIPTYFLAFELLTASVSYFYSVVDTDGIRSIIVFTYRLRDTSMILSVIMVLFTGRISWDSIVVTILLWSVYFGTCWVFPQNVRYIEPVASQLLYGNVAYVLVRSRMIPKERFISFCVLISRFLIVAIAIGLFSLDSMRHYLSSNYMTFANALMMPLAFLIFKISCKPGFPDIALIIFGLLLLVLFGSRGAFLVLLIQVILTWLPKLRQIKKTPLLFGITVLGAIVLFGLLFGNLDENILLSGLDGYGRTLQKLLSGEFFRSKRTQLWSFLLSKSWKDSLLGAGLGADRYYLPMRFTGVDATYAHNLLIEWIVDFGIVGLVSFFVVTVALLHPFFTVLSKESKAFYIMLFTTSYLFLMFSSSWITTAGFYILCALAMNARHAGRISE